MVSTTSNSQMPRAFGWSAMLHAGVFGVLIAIAWWSQRTNDRDEHVFEVVAGPGDNYAATEAPTQAVPETTVSVTIPRAQPPRPQPRQAPPPVQVPVQRAAPEPTPPRNPVQPRPEPVREEPKPQPQTLSYQDFVRENGQPKPRTPAAPAPIKPKEIDLGRIAAAQTNNVREGAGGTAMTADTSDLEKAYVRTLIERIRQAMMAAGVTDVREVAVQFQVSAGGAISSATITRGSGSAEFDRAVLAAFRSIRPLGPPPTGKAEIYRTVIRLREG